MNATEVIQGEINKRKQELEALEVSLRIIKGEASVSVPSVARVKDEDGTEERKAVGVRDSGAIGKWKTCDSIQKERFFSSEPLAFLHPYKRWSAWDDRKLGELYDAGMNDEQIGKLLGRSWKSVNVRRTRLGLVSFVRNRKRSPETEKRRQREREKLRDRVKVPVDGQLVYPTAKHKRKDYKPPVYRVVRGSDKEFKTWTKLDIENLKNMVDGGLSDAEIADYLGRSIDAIRIRRNRMGMKRRESGARKGVLSKPAGRKRRADKDYARWTRSEEQMLVGMASNGFSPRQIANRLRRSTPAVKIKLYNLKDRFKG